MLEILPPFDLLYRKHYLASLLTSLVIVIVFSLCFSVESVEGAASWSQTYSFYTSDYYGTLGITAAATKKDIQKAYRRLSLQYHPDKLQPGDDAPLHSQRFLEISEAYEILKDDELRAEYDSIQEKIPARFRAQYGKPWDWRVVVSTIVIVVSCLQYMYWSYWHRRMTALAIKTQKYKLAVEHASRRGEEPPPVVVNGYEPAKLTDVLIIQMWAAPLYFIRWSWHMCLWLWSVLLGKDLSRSEVKWWLQRRMKWSEVECEQFLETREKAIEKAKEDLEKKQFQRRKAAMR